MEDGFCAEGTGGVDGIGDFAGERVEGVGHSLAVFCKAFLVVVVVGAGLFHDALPCNSGEVGVVAIACGHSPPLSAEVGFGVGGAARAGEYGIAYHECGVVCFGGVYEVLAEDAGGFICALGVAVGVCPVVYALGEDFGIGVAVVELCYGCLTRCYCRGLGDEGGVGVH